MLKLTECALTSKNASFILTPIMAWGGIRILDLSGNNIGIEPEPFFEWIRTSLLPISNINKLILSDNMFEASNINYIISDLKKWEQQNLKVTF